VGRLDLNPVRRRWTVLFQVLVLTGYSIGAAALPMPVAAAGNTNCQPTPSQRQAGHLASSGNFIVGVRATIEGQSLALCAADGPPEASGSFHWVALQNSTPAWDIGVNIVQLGYGRCANTNNIPQIGTNCNGNNYWYWAWGSYCGSSINGTLPGVGPVPLRIGSALAGDPANHDFYVLRQSHNGIAYYEGFVDGVLLEGTDALGNHRLARVAQSQLCWNSDQTYRRLAYFGETFNVGDSMGGWSGSTRNHLDYDPLRYSYATGWKATHFGFVAPCNAGTGAPYSCTVAEADHLYIDSR
jgi:hypothetical protein